MLTDIIETLLKEKDKDIKIIAKEIVSMLEPYSS